MSVRSRSAPWWKDESVFPDLFPGAMCSVPDRPHDYVSRYPKDLTGEFVANKTYPNFYWTVPGDRQATIEADLAKLADEDCYYCDTDRPNVNTILEGRLDMSFTHRALMLARLEARITASYLRFEERKAQARADGTLLYEDGDSMIVSTPSKP